MNESQAVGLTVENVAGGRFDVTDLLWDKYQRQSVAIGGDLTARSTFETTLAGANEWLERAGWLLYETYGGAATWQGRLVKITADLYGQVVSVDLNAVYNAVIVRYQTTVGGSFQITPVAIDQDSIDRYGYRQFVFQSSILLTNASALDVRDSVLARSAKPMAQAEQLRASGRGGVTVSLSFAGLVKSLQYQHYEESGGGNDNIQVAIQLTLAALISPDVLEGEIQANPLIVRDRSDIVDVWTRLRDLAALGDDAGNFYVIGCYAGNQLDYFMPDPNFISYYAELDSERRLVYFDNNNNVIPPALLKPARIVFRRDLLAGRSPTFPLINDVRAMLIGSINYSKNSIQVSGLKQDNNSQLQAILDSLDLQ